MAFIASLANDHCTSKLMTTDLTVGLTDFTCLFSHMVLTKLGVRVRNIDYR